MRTPGYYFQKKKASPIGKTFDDFQRFYFEKPVANSIKENGFAVHEFLFLEKTGTQRYGFKLEYHGKFIQNYGLTFH